MKQALALAGLLSTSVLAGTADYIPNVRASVGTQGFGLEVSEALIPKYLTLSAQGNYLRAGHRFDQNGTNYQGHARLLTAGLLLNVHPFANGFRISGGIYNNNNRLSADSTEPVTQNGIPVASHVSVKAQFKRFAPYAGAGWVWGQRITASLDAGVMFQGKAKTDFTVDCIIPGCQTVAMKDENDVRNEADQYRLYPVVRLGVGF